MNVFLIATDEYHPGEPILNALRRVLPEETYFELAPEGELFQIQAATEIVVIAKMNVQSCENREPWLTTSFDHWIHEWVSAGGKLLVLHAGMARYSGETAVRKLTGGEFITHPAPLEVEYKSDSASFKVIDEHYMVQIDKDCEVFLTSHSKAGDQPAGWRKTVGRGKVLALTPTHFDENWSNSPWLEMMKRETEWLLS
jgi:uncharacterized protein